MRAVGDYGAHVTYENLMKKCRRGMVIIDAIDSRIAGLYIGLFSFLRSFYSRSIEGVIYSANDRIDRCFIDKAGSVRRLIGG